MCFIHFGKALNICQMRVMRKIRKFRNVSHYSTVIPYGLLVQLFFFFFLFLLMDKTGTPTFCHITLIEVKLKAGVKTLIGLP